MNYLTDVNVWVALALIGHVHHHIARKWFEEPGTERISFCRTSQKGLLRLLTNGRVMGPNVLTAKQAWDLYDAFYTDRRVTFVPEPQGIEEAWRAATKEPRTGPNFWTDAYLSAFAYAAGFTIVTFDRGFRRHRTVPVRLLTNET